MSVDQPSERTLLDELNAWLAELHERALRSDGDLEHVRTAIAESRGEGLDSPSEPMLVVITNSRSKRSPYSSEPLCRRSSGWSRTGVQQRFTKEVCIRHSQTERRTEHSGFMFPSRVGLAEAIIAQP